MTTTERKFGLTYGQIISTITLLGTIFLLWLNLNIKVQANEIKIADLESKYKETSAMTEVFRKENREDHKEIVKKLEEFQKYFINVNEYFNKR